MIPWNPIAGWMCFPTLSESAGISYSFTLGYRLKDNSSEVWTARFNRFKEDERAALIAGSRLFYAAVPQLFTEVKLPAGECVFVAALSSGETTARADRAIPFITNECAKLLKVRFELGALSKNPHQKIHTLGGIAQRNAELDKANYQSIVLGAPNVFVFDDFITRGDTLSRIALAILKENPNSKVYGVALAKAESTPYCPNPDNGHIPSRWETVWQQGEAEAAGREKPQ